MRPRSIEDQLAELAVSLRREYTARGVPAGEVDDAITAVRARFAEATVLTYVPILVERDVRERLHRPAPAPGPVPQAPPVGAPVRRARPFGFGTARA